MNRNPDKELLSFIEQYGALQPDSKFSYVTIHALEEERSVTSHSLLGKEYAVADCYWVFGCYGIFVSVLVDLRRASFVNYSPRQDKKIAHEFFVVTKSNLTQATFERILEKLGIWIESNARNFPHATTVIANSDFGG